MRVGYVSAEWSTDFTDELGHAVPGGTTWLRCCLPAKALNDNGFFAVVGAELGRKASGELVVKTWDDQVHDGLDIIVLQRWMDAAGPEVIQQARTTGQVVIHDVDDWYDGIPASNQAFRASHPRFGLTNEYGQPLNRVDARRLGDKRVLRENRNFYRESLRASSAITVSTRFLQRNLKVADTPVYLVPNALDIDRYPRREQSEIPTIGWTGSTLHRAGDLEILKGILGPFLNRHNLRFHHSGHIEGHPEAGYLAGVSK